MLTCVAIDQLPPGGPPAVATGFAPDPMDRPYDASGKQDQWCIVADELLRVLRGKIREAEGWDADSLDTLLGVLHGAMSLHQRALIFDATVNWRETQGRFEE